MGTRSLLAINLAESLETRRMVKFSTSKNIFFAVNVYKSLKIQALNINISINYDLKSEKSGPVIRKYR